MTTDSTEQRAAFRALHESGCFVIPNPWDRGGARRLEKLGFKALASTSAGYAWARGCDDGELTCDEVLEHLRDLCDATALPVNADFEAGFAANPDGIFENVRRAVETGVAGLSIEDRVDQDLYALPTALERLRAAREAIDKSGQNVMLVARTEGYLIGRTDLQETIRRLVAYADAGADCLYAPCVVETDAIRAIVAAVAPKPINVLLLGKMRVSELADVGVRRISIGSGFANASWKAFEAAAVSVRDQGTLPG